MTDELTTVTLSMPEDWVELNDRTTLAAYITHNTVRLLRGWADNRNAQVREVDMPSGDSAYFCRNNRDSTWYLCDLVLQDTIPQFDSNRNVYYI